MAAAEKIAQYVQRLPEKLQAEVLDFVEYLLQKAERETAEEEQHDWSDLSVSAAMRGMEEEDEPLYSDADLKQPFS